MLKRAITVSRPRCRCVAIISIYKAQLITFNGADPLRRRHSLCGIRESTFALLICVRSGSEASSRVMKQGRVG